MSGQIHVLQFNCARVTEGNASASIPALQVNSVAYNCDEDRPTACVAMEIITNPSFNECDMIWVMVSVNNGSGVSKAAVNYGCSLDISLDPEV